jgi:hypothetical protein
MNKLKHKISENNTENTPKEKTGILANLHKKEHPSQKEKVIKDKEIEKELKSIYRDNKGAMPNLTKLDIIPQNRLRNTIFIMIGVLLLISLFTFLGFFIFQPKPKFGGDKVNLEIKAPFTLNSGEDIHYEMRLTNNEEVSLTKVRLDVYLPTGFIFINSNLPIRSENPEANSNIKTWEINDLFPERSQIILINGRLIGSVNSKQTVSATLSYTPANFNSEFAKNGSMTTEITGSLLDFSLEHSAQIANSEITEITAKIINNSKETGLTNLEFDLNFPPEFTLIDSQILLPDQTAAKLPKIDKNFKAEASPKIINLASLLPQEEKKILFRGKFDVTESKSIDLNFQAKLKGAADEYFLQKEENFSVEIIKGELLTNLIIQGSNQDKAINFGDNLNFLLSLENKSKKTLGDIKVRAVLDSTILDWNTLNDKNNGILEENQILWTKDQIPALNLLLPEDEIEIAFQIKLKSPQDLKKIKPEDSLVKSFFEAQINKMDNNDIDELISQSNTIINELNTDLAFQGQGRYFGDNSETLGSGPLPPIVGQKTTYKIFWKLTNSLHEISDIEVKTKLPGNINYEGKENISTGNIFKNQNNELVWQIARIPNTVTEATANFEISLTPQSADVGKILTLLQEGTVIATDSQTKGQITLSFSGLTTNLDSDPLGKNKGLIQAE